MNLVLQPGVLPYTCYPATPQALYNDMFTLGAAVQTTSLTGVLLQDAQPSADQVGFVWIRTNGGVPVYPAVWLHFSGEWRAKHPLPAGDKRLFLFQGTSAEVDSLDGGAAGVINDFTGPFWAIVTAFAARMPLGVGTLPISGTAVAVGDTGGLEKVTLLAAESGVGPHTHAEKSADAAADAIGGPGANRRTFGTTLSTPTLTEIRTDTTQADATSAHQNMPPYKAVFFIQRTARVWLSTPIA